MQGAPPDASFEIGCQAESFLRFELWMGSGQPPTWSGQAALDVDGSVAGVLDLRHADPNVPTAFVAADLAGEEAPTTASRAGRSLTVRLLDAPGAAPMAFDLAGSHAAIDPVASVCLGWRGALRPSTTDANLPYAIVGDTSADPDAGARVQADCEKLRGDIGPGLGFVQSADLNGDGAGDLVLDFHAFGCSAMERCDASGCPMEMWLARLDGSVDGDGRADLVLNLALTGCSTAASLLCGSSGCLARAA